MVSDCSMDDLLELYYGKDKSNWSGIRVSVSKNLEISWGAFHRLPMNKRAQVNYFGEGNLDELLALYDRD